MQMHSVAKPLLWILGLSLACGGNTTRPLLPDHIDVTPRETTIVAGDSVSLQGQVLTSGDQPLDGFNITWSSKDNTIATVDANGLVTGKSAGSVQIAATTSGVDGVAQITVMPRPVLTVTRQGNGTVTSTPAGVACGATCSAAFRPSAVVSLSAVADVGNTFTGWTGACAGLAECQLTMTANAGVTATFVPGERLTVNVTGPGAVTTTPSGINCAAGSCTSIFPTGTSVTLLPTPGASAAFIAWGGACSGSGACVVSMDQARSVTATFETVHTLSVQVVGSGDVTATGLDCTSGTCTKQYAAGTALQLHATAADGWLFTGYTGDCTGLACALALGTDAHVTATFVHLHSLTLSISGDGTGSVTSSPAGLSCTTALGVCTGQFIEGTLVQLTPSAGPGSALQGWGGACTGAGPCSLTLGADESLSAVFIAVQTLSVAVSGSGTVTSSPAGLSCSAGSCSAQFAKGASVSLTATAGAHALFNGFGGDCSGTTCALTLSADHVVSAAFGAAFGLTVTTAGNGGGAVTSNPSGINCPGACTQLFPVGTNVTLTPQPDASSSFTGWSTLCAGTSACSFSMGADIAIRATFVAGQRLTVNVTGPGSVTSAPAGINCSSGSCSAIFPTGTPVTLTATPGSSARFDGFSGDCSGNTCALTLNASASVTAPFETVRTLTVHVSGSGSVSGNGLSCSSSTCTQAYPDLTALDLTASASAGWQFQGFTGDCTGASCSLSMSANRTVTASFVLVHTLTVNFSGDGQGAITSNPAGINCGPGGGSGCSAQFVDGAVIQLSAAPTASSLMQGWSGGGCTGTAGCTVTLTADTAVSATIVAAQALTVAFAGTAAGTVSASPGSLNCSSSAGSCTQLFPRNTLLSLSALPGTHSMFTAWSGGGCTGSSGCSLTLSADTTVTATFAPAFALAVTVQGSGAGTVSSAPGGYTCASGTCTFRFAPGTAVTLSAAANLAGGSQFTAWGGACSGASTCPLTLNSDLAATATFTHYNQLTISSVTGSGSVGPTDASWSCTSGNAPCTHAYATGSSVTLHAAPGTSWAFDPGFGGDCSGSPDCTLQISVDRAVTAVFQPQLTINIAGSGTVGGDATCATSKCTPDFAPGTSLNLTATPAQGYLFSGWTNGCTGSSACSLTLSAPATVTATFVRLYTVSVTTQGAGTGSVSTSVTPVSQVVNGNTITWSYVAGASLTLTATAGGSSAFSGWGGDCVGTTPTCNLNNLSANRAATATFGQVQTLTIVIPAGGAGQVTSEDGLIDCLSDGTGKTCTQGYSSGARVALDAIAGTPSDPLHAVFKSFTIGGSECPGDQNFGSEGFCTTPAISASMTVTVTFKKAFDLQVWAAHLASGSCGGGRVDTVPATQSPTLGSGSGGCSFGANSGTGAIEILEQGTQVTVTATPNATSYFAGWLGLCTGTAPCTITMDKDYISGANTLTAQFGAGAGP